MRKQKLEQQLNFMKQLKVKTQKRVIGIDNIIEHLEKEIKEIENERDERRKVKETL